ncbi:MAG: hypothetical protein Q7J38_06230 [Gallionella sp.]|nr:hypothetical protein [Gallionella sp.]
MSLSHDIMPINLLINVDHVSTRGEFKDVALSEIAGFVLHPPNNKFIKGHVMKKLLVSLLLANMLAACASQKQMSEIEDKLFPAVEISGIGAGMLGD